jgi:hypothetical protein
MEESHLALPVRYDLSVHKGSVTFLARTEAGPPRTVFAITARGHGGTTSVSSTTNRRVTTIRRSANHYGLGRHGGRPSMKVDHTFPREVWVTRTRHVCAH